VTSRARRVACFPPRARRSRTRLRLRLVSPRLGASLTLRPLSLTPRPLRASLAVAHQGELEEHLEYQSFTADTEDHEDHTFCGIFFDLACSEKLPLKYVEVSSLWVRGDLGPLTVWTNPSGHGGGNVQSAEGWTQIYERTHEPSFQDFVELKFETPIVLHPSDGRLGVYVHSKRPGDQSIVYDDARYSTLRSVRDDGRVVIHPGVAHLSNKPFGRRAPWGGDALRTRRLFVGRVSYGARWLLWNPEVHARFPIGFRDAVLTVLKCGRREGCGLYWLGDEILYYVMNKCGWNWFGERMRPEGEEDPDAARRRAEEEELKEKIEGVVRMFGVSEEQAMQLLPRMDPGLLHMIAQHARGGDDDDDASDGGGPRFQIAFATDDDEDDDDDDESVRSDEFEEAHDGDEEDEDYQEDEEDEEEDGVQGHPIDEEDSSEVSSEDSSEDGSEEDPGEVDSGLGGSSGREESEPPADAAEA
jgi:hypothetical protein